jgi:hypothetical protein
MKCTCESIAPQVRMCPSPASTSVDALIARPDVTPSITPGLPALPIAAMRPSRMPTSAFRIPVTSTMTALVMTRSGDPAWRLAVVDCPIPSRMTLPPPNFASSP